MTLFARPFAWVDLRGVGSNTEEQVDKDVRDATTESLGLGMGLHVPAPHCFMAAVLAEEWAGQGQGGGGHVIAAVITGVRKQAPQSPSAAQQQHSQQQPRDDHLQWCVHMEWRCSSCSVLETIASDFRAWFDGMFQGTLNLISAKRHTSRSSVLSLPAAIVGIHRTALRRRHGGGSVGEEEEEAAATTAAPFSGSNDVSLFEAGIPPKRHEFVLPASAGYGSEAARQYALQVWKRVQGNSKV